MNGNKVSLTYVVNNILNKRNTDDKEFARLYQIGVSGIRELSWDVEGNVKTEKLTMQPNNTVIIPADYINWVKVGVMGADNKIYTLTLNKQISLYNSTSDNRVVASGSYLVGNYDVMNNVTDYHNFFIDGANYNLFGVGGGISDTGYFNVDEANCVIVFGSEVTSSEIYLEYVFDPTRCETDDYQVHIFCQRALEEYINWQSIEMLNTVSEGTKMRAEKKYLNQKRLARARMKPFRMGDALDTSRRNINLGFKL
jgi:hypothetical protein